MEKGSTLQDPTIFTRQKDALAWLHEHFERAYPSAGKFSTDCRDGACLVQADKTIRLKDLQAYAKRIGFDKRSSAIGEERARRKEEADIRKAEAEARIKERQDEREAREMDDQWVRRERAEEETCIWVSRLRDSTAYHLSKAGPAIVHVCGASPARLAEVQALLDGALIAACNEIARAGEITVEIDEIEEDAC